MHIVKVCIGDPREARKGDAKLLMQRAVALSKMEHSVSIVCFNLPDKRLTLKCTEENIKWSDGIEIFLVKPSLLGALVLAPKLLRHILTVPIQVLPSLILGNTCSDAVASIIREADIVHYYHCRSFGLLRMRQRDRPVVLDAIDSYTLNYSNRLRVLRMAQLFSPGSLVLREEYRRMRMFESSLCLWLKGYSASALLTVSKTDLAFFGKDLSNKGYVVPIGSTLIHSQKQMRGFKGRLPLRCIFFGNLDYEPNLTASKILLSAFESVKQGKSGRYIGFGEQVELTIAGRNASETLKRKCESVGVSVISPVGDMASLVYCHDLAIFPIISGSGMQSKLLEAIACGCLVVCSERVGTPAGLVRDIDFLGADSEETVLQAIQQVLDGEIDVDMMRASALEKIQRFSISECTEELLRVYREVST